MYLRPCRNCSIRETCEKYTDMPKSLQGTGITSAKFICEQFYDLYHPGERVICLLRNRFEMCESNVKGIVTNTKNDGRVVVFMDPEDFEAQKPFGNSESENLFIRLWPKFVEKTNEPDANVCPACGKPDGVENSEDFYCPKCSLIIG